MSRLHWSIVIVLGIATVIATIKAESDHRREQRKLEQDDADLAEIARLRARRAELESVITSATDTLIHANRDIDASVESALELLYSFADKSKLPPLPPGDIDTARLKHEREGK